MNRLGRHILLLTLLLLACASAALAEAVTAVDPSEFCGAQPPTEIRCPKTSASLCLCAMKDKSLSAELYLVDVVETFKSPRMIHPKPTCLILPEFPEVAACETVISRVPTPPPRA